MLASICESRSQKPRKQNRRKVKRLFLGFQTNFFDVSTNMAKDGTEVAERSHDSDRRSSYRRPTVKHRFLVVSIDQGNFWEKSLNGHATLVGGHATVSRLSKNVFWTFQAIRKFFVKSH